MKHLLNIAFLNRNGFKISRIAGLSPLQLKDHVLRLSEGNFEQKHQVMEMIVAMLDLDEEAFDKIISTNILRIGFEKTFFQIVFPMMKRVGILWQTGITRPSHEHFISHLVRQKIIVASDAHLYRMIKPSSKFLLFLPEKEFHELPLLFINYVLKRRGQQTLFLGPSVPLEDVIACCEDFKPHYIYTACTSHPNNGRVQSFINTLAERCSRSQIYISGVQIIENNPSFPENVNHVISIEQCVQLIDKQVEKATVIN
jgi:methanogenic corrinoid protein MtbC1